MGEEAGSRAIRERKGDRGEDRRADRVHMAHVWISLQMGVTGSYKGREAIIPTCLDPSAVWWG
jgi:hypothetical protein